ncbi:MAG: hypothetical protein E7012_05880 [Alphaproteobacteria bacterium]|nr:hypothetical protein [Alphaproteobacteria bacterium]
MKNILEICQEAASLVATQRPTDLFNTSSQQEAIFLSVVKDTLDSLLRYGDWQELTKEGCIRTTEGKVNYYLADYCPDFYCLINNTVFIKDTHEKVVGSITPEQWMREKYFNVPSLNLKFKIQNGMFKFLTPPPSDLKIVFQYRSSIIAYDGSKNYCGEEKTTLSKNTDIPIFDEFLVKKGIVWRWYRRNGMPYEEEYNEYEKEVRNRFASGLATKDICLSGQIFEAAENGVTINVIKSN